MIAAIAAAEVAFWVVLLLGLTLRYVARQRHASTITLLCLPLVDVLLVAFVLIDLARGAEPSQSHALGAVYLGVTVAFGHATIRWADGWFGHWFDERPRPAKPAKGSREQVRGLWTEWLRVLAMDVVAGAMLLVMLVVEGFYVPRTSQALGSDPYWSTMALLGIVTVIWFLAGPAFSRRSR